MRDEEELAYIEELTDICKQLLGIVERVARCNNCSCAKGCLSCDAKALLKNLEKEIN